MNAVSCLTLLSQALRRLPGIGPRSAQRLTYHLMQYDREGAQLLGDALLQAVQQIRNCSQCNNFTENKHCETCIDPARDRSLLCVVETPADQLMIEQTLTYRGLYFVLMGRLSPLDGIGPKDIQLEKLTRRAMNGVVTEVILATNFTNEGEATAHYVSQILKARSLKVSRLARGVPVGGELEYTDASTVARALLDRRFE